MANLLSMPSMSIGLMGARPRQQNSLLDLLAKAQQAAQYDAGDDYFANPQSRPAGSGVPVLENGTVGYVPPTPGAGQAQRDRVNPLNVIFRGLAPNLSGALDSERARLQAQADAPQRAEVSAENERIARALGPQALLAYRTNSAEFGESLGYQYRPQVVAEGSAIAIPGMGSNSVNERKAVVGDRVVGLGGNGQDPRELLTVSPSYDDETKRINATNPVAVAQNSQLRDPQTGELVAQGLVRPDLTSVAPGGQIYATDQNGNTSLVGESTAVKPMSDADQAAVAKAEGTLATIRTASTRAQSILDNIDSGRLNLGPLSNRISGALNAVGMSNENSLAYDELNNWAKEARDAILAAESGVKTDQDAIRALDRIISSKGDENVVRQSVQRFIEAQRATADVLNRDISRRSSAGRPTAQSGSVAQPTSAAEYQALPSGTLFMAPDGSTRRKP